LWIKEINGPCLRKGRFLLELKSKIEQKFKPTPHGFQENTHVLHGVFLSFFVD